MRMCSLAAALFLGVLQCTFHCTWGNCAHYTFDVGDFKATVLSDGSVPWNASAAFPSLPMEAVENVLSANFWPAGIAPFYYNVLHVDTGEKKILFDAGSGFNFGEDTGKLVEHMAAAGLDPNVVDLVILSHGHVDHLGGVLKEDGSFNFPNAKFYISRQEHEFWMQARVEDLPSDLPRDLNELILRVAKNVLGAVSEKLNLFELGSEVIPGVESKEAVGHTPGHTAFIIRSGESSLFVAGDAMVWDIFSVEQPEWRMAFDADQVTAINTRLSLLGMLAGSKMNVLLYHTSFPGLGYIGRDKEGFRFRPSLYEF